MVHGEAYHGVGHFVGLGQVLLGGGWEAAVCGELGDEGIEVAAAEHTGVLHPEVQLVAGHPVLLGVDEEGEVGVVVAHAWHVVEEPDARHTAQCLAVGHLPPARRAAIASST